MSMKREIFEALHCAETETEHIAKIQPFLKSVLTRFQAEYYPWQNLSLDEMVIGWKGPFKNRQCNASKPKKVPHKNIWTLQQCNQLYIQPAKLLPDRNFLWSRWQECHQGVPDIVRPHHNGTSHFCRQILQHQKFSGLPAAKTLLLQRYGPIQQKRLPTRDKISETKTSRKEVFCKLYLGSYLLLNLKPKTKDLDF